VVDGGVDWCGLGRCVATVSLERSGETRDVGGGGCSDKSYKGKSKRCEEGY
jgi:hypothetical protein